MVKLTFLSFTFYRVGSGSKMLAKNISYLFEFPYTIRPRMTISSSLS